MDGPRGRVSAARFAALAALRGVVDPELGLDIVDLGLLYGLWIDDKTVRAAMTLTTRGCPLGRLLVATAAQALEGAAAGRQVEVALVWEPSWSPEMLSEEGRTALRAL